MDLKKVVLKQKPHQDLNHSGNLLIPVMLKDGLINLKMSRYENLKIILS